LTKRLAFPLADTLVEIYEEKLAETLAEIHVEKLAETRVIICQYVGRKVGVKNM